MTEPTGWRCPRCNKINAPWRAECDCAPYARLSPWYPSWPYYYPDWTYRPRPWWDAPPVYISSTTGSTTLTDCSVVVGE